MSAENLRNHSPHPRRYAVLAEAFKFVTNIVNHDTQRSNFFAQRGNLHPRACPRTPSSP